MSRMPLTYRYAADILDLASGPAGVGSTQTGPNPRMESQSMPKATRILSHFENLPTGELVDQLGGVKAEIADLETRQQSLRAELLKRCITEAEGAVYAATVTQAMRWTLDAKAVHSEMGDDWWNGRCKSALVTTVTVA